MSNSQNSEPQAQKTTNSSEDYVERFSTERSTWSDSIVNIGKRFREVENLAEVQVDLYSRRQEALEYQYKLIGVHTKLKNLYSVEWKKAYDNAGQNEDIRYNDKEKAKIAEGLVANLKFKLDSVSNQVEFFRETIKTIDNMVFGVKHRIDIENFKVGTR